MARLAIVFLATALAACSGKDPYNPGEPIGEFHVTAKLKSTTCGQAPDPWEFDVKLRHDARTLFWVQGGAPVKGAADTKARATFQTTDTRTLRDANAKTGTAACVVSRTDRLDVELQSDEGPATEIEAATAFVGTLAYEFAPGAGSDCSDQLLSASGDFEALPCDIRYDIRAARTKDLPK